MKKSSALRENRLAEVFVQIPRGYWIDDWSTKWLYALSGTAGEKIIRAIVSYRTEIATLESWGGFHTRNLLMSASGVAHITGIRLPQLLDVLREQTAMGVWSCKDCRSLDPLVSFILSPKSLESPVEG